jgi:CheY-like chemotaxis protein
MPTAMDLAETPEGQAWRYRGEAVVSRADQSKRDGEISHGGRLAILLVDDDRRLCDSLAALLSVVGYDVVNVYEGLEALAAAGIRPFDAAIIDISLPDVGGAEVLRRLREADPEMGTLVLSGAETLGDVIESLNMGADAFALKPSNPEVLLSKVGKVARLGRLQRGLGGPEAGFGDLFENIGDGVFRSDLNRAGAGILGFDGPEGLLYGRLKAWEIFSSREEYEALMMGVLDEGEARRVLSRFRKRDGDLGWLSRPGRAQMAPSSASRGSSGTSRTASGTRRLWRRSTASAPTSVRWRPWTRSEGSRSSS